MSIPLAAAGNDGKTASTALQTCLRRLRSCCRLTELEVRIPRLQVVTLERLVAADGRTVRTVLARELRDLVSVHSGRLSREVPGFEEALLWPEELLGT